MLGVVVSMSDETFTQLRRANDHLEGMRSEVAKIGRTMGLDLFSLDTCATPGHVIIDLGRIREAVSPPGPEQETNEVSP